MAVNANETNSRKVEKIAIEILQNWVGPAGTVLDLGKGDGPDFKILYTDGREAIGEVGLHEDPEVAEAWVAIHKSATPQQIQLPAGTGMWAVGFSTVPNIKRIKSQLPLFLVQLHNQEIFHLDVNEVYPRDEIGDLARDLGIDYLTCYKEYEQDLVTYFLPTTGGAIPTDPDLIVDWVESGLLSEDFKDSWTKLLPFRSQEKHVFFMTSNRTVFGIDEIIQSQVLPKKHPHLPGALTHIWLCSRYEGGSTIYWSNSSGWQRISFCAQLVNPSNLERPHDLR